MTLWKRSWSRSWTGFEFRRFPGGLKALRPADVFFPVEMGEMQSSSDCIRYYRTLRRKKRKERARCDTWDRYLVSEDDGGAGGRGLLDVVVQVGCKSLDRHRHPTIWDVSRLDEAVQVGLDSFWV